MVAAFVVVVVASEVCVVFFVPNVFQGLHCLRFFFVKSCEEVGIYRSAVASDSLAVNSHRRYQKAFVACHQVGEVSNRLRGVSVFPDVDVDFMESFT